MVKPKSTSRFSSIKKPVILAQTDTTVGFASQDYTQLSTIKSRPSSKPFIKIFSNFTTFSDDRNRVPHSQKSFVRRSKKTTFIVGNNAFRINSLKKNSQVQRDMDYYYSTSANEKSKSFERVFCEQKADIIIEDKNGLCENISSTLIKINNKRKRKIR